MFSLRCDPNHLVEAVLCKSAISCSSSMSTQSAGHTQASRDRVPLTEHRCDGQRTPIGKSVRGTDIHKPTRPEDAPRKRHHLQQGRLRSRSMRRGDKGTHRALTKQHGRATERRARSGGNDIEHFGHKLHTRITKVTRFAICLNQFLKLTVVVIAFVCIRFCQHQNQSVWKHMAERLATGSRSAASRDDCLPLAEESVLLLSCATSSSSVGICKCNVVVLLQSREGSIIRSIRSSSTTALVISELMTRMVSGSIRQCFQVR